MITTDIQKIESILREAGETIIKPRFKSLQNEDVREKNPGDLVTIADEESERFIASRLKDMHPDSIIVGEEAVEADPSILDVFHKNSDDHIWVIDPVDGTSNFVHGREEFCILLALVSSNQTVAGWCYNIMTQKMTSVEIGSGAYHNGVRLSINDDAQLHNANGYIGSKYFSPEMRSHVKESSPRINSFTSLHCAGLEYDSVARQNADFAIYTRMKPWDHLAGILLCNEADGVALKWDGSQYLPSDMKDYGLLIAGNSELWTDVRDLFLKPFMD